MKYNFDKEYNRRNTDSYKWNVLPSENPMWVADMDFRAADEIIEAIRLRTDHGIFGYNDIPDEWYNAYINWWKTRHNFEIKKDWLIFSTGVVPTISSAVRKLTTPNENVVLMTPAYNIFFNSVVNNGCRVIESDLIYDGENYFIGFDRLEKDLSDPQTTLLILCNPHNPTGRIWTREELERTGELCLKYNVTVISDEIHCDITAPGKEYIPFASVSDTCRDISLTCVAPTKCFNLAGMQTSAVFVPNNNLRHKIWRALNTDEVAEPNTFAVPVTAAAFNKGGEWLDEMREYVWKNKEYVTDFLRKEIPLIKPVCGDATYLMWLDISGYKMNSNAFQQDLKNKTGLYVSSGLSYGRSGDGFLRLNVACPRSNVTDGLMRLKKYTAGL